MIELGLKQYMLGMLATALFGTSLVITVGYISQYIYLIGYNTQLIPLFSGLVIGVLLFSFAGSVISLRLRHGIVYGIMIAIVLFITVFETIALENYVITDTPLIILSIFLSSGFMPVFTFVVDSMFPERGFKSRTIFGIFSGVVSLIIIVVVAVIYELSGQDTMATEITLVGLMSAVVLLIMFSQTGRSAPEAAK